MKPVIIKLIYIILVFTVMTNQISAQNKPKNKNREVRNNWGLGFVYTESGFGLSGSYFFKLSKSSDLYFNLLFSNVTDSREMERSDLYGNTYVPNKINRIFMMPLSIGLQKELFKGEIEGNFSPVINVGIAPTLLLANPYNRNFFSAIGYTSAKFAIGPFAGAGLNYKQGDNMSLGFYINYYYLPVIGSQLESLQNSKIKNVGGVQLSLGFNFLK